MSSLIAHLHWTSRNKLSTIRENWQPLHMYSTITDNFGSFRFCRKFTKKLIMVATVGPNPAKDIFYAHTYIHQRGV